MGVYLSEAARRRRRPRRNGHFIGLAIGTQDAHGSPEAF
jgi:hypothetical protein